MVQALRHVATGRCRVPEMSSQTIGLCMIVRDEAEIIERCIDSVRGLIDTWTIVDTGSEDETPELIERALADVRGTLHRRPWRDFGANRTELMELARGSADYLLLIDADQTVKQTAPLPELRTDAYLLRHLGRMDYAFPRLVRGDREWHYVGTTHEYLSSDSPFEKRILDELAIVHHLDAGRRWEKQERDVRLLEEELRRNPENVRATFYLAQTLRDMGETDRALELYARRVELGGWDQEVFYAAYQIGVVTARTDLIGAVRPLLEAFAMRPSRAEPLFQLARVCRKLGWHEAAYAFARQGLAIPYPKDILFVHRDAYEWGLAFELSIAAYWVGRPAEALDLTDRLLAEADLPGGVESRLRSNRRFSVEAMRKHG